MDDNGAMLIPDVEAGVAVVSAEAKMAKAKNSTE